MKQFSGLLLTLLALAMPNLAADNYATYRNARFGYAIQYPANFLTPQRESDNGDGRAFLSGNQKVRLTVYASYNVENRTLQQEQAHVKRVWLADHARVTYSRTVVAKNCFVTSGYFRDRIFYEKTVLWHGAFHTMLWEYPPSLKLRLNGPLKRSFDSFATGNFQVPQIFNRPAPGAKIERAKPVSKPAPVHAQHRLAPQSGY